MIPLKYKDRRTEGQTTLRQCQLAQLHLLYVLDEICRRHNIEYVIDGGTLIGAMRHNGFIPWDDDLDVAMMRSDYKRFLQLAKSELPKDVILQTPDSLPERITPFAKLRDAYSFYAEQSMSISLGRHNGIFIDIFPYDKIPDLGVLEFPLVKLCKLAFLYGRALRISGGRGWLAALFGGWAAIPLYGIHHALKVMFRVVLLFRRCSHIYYGLETPFFRPYPYSAFYPITYHQFEDGRFPVPADSADFLFQHYGDWRKPPPIEKQKGDHGRLILPFQAVMVEGALKW